MTAPTKSRKTQRTMAAHKTALPKTTKRDRVIKSEMKQLVDDVLTGLEPKPDHIAERRIPVYPKTAPPVHPAPNAPDRSVAQQAFVHLREDMVAKHITVTELKMVHIKGPKGELYVFPRDGKWYIGENLRDLPLAESKFYERAVTWAQNRLV